MRTAFITGATGFVGTALCRRLLHEGLQVRGAVHTPSSQRCLPQNSEAVFIDSIGPDTSWASALAGVDIVVHLAARTHVMRDDSYDPLEAYRLINLAGTERLAHAAAASGVKRFIYLSSVKVNGEGREGPYTELDVPAPEDAYGISKCEAEQALRQVEKETGMEVVILRPLLVYGQGVKANFLNLMRIVGRGIPLPLARIENKRSMVYLDNLVDAIIVCISKDQAAGKTYLISDGDDVSTPELIRRVSKALGRPARLFHFPLFLIRLAGKLTGKTEAVNRLLGSLVVDSSKIRRELGWIPQYTMAQGLRETAVWYKRQL